MRVATGSLGIRMRRVLHECLKNIRARGIGRENMYRFVVSQ